jgi:hypothetical protein
MVTRYACAAILSAILVSAAGAQSVLRWKFQSGEQLHYTRTRDQTSAKTVAGVRTQDTIQATTDMTLVVAEVAEDHSAQIKLLIDRIRYHRKSNGGETHYDSSTDAAPAGADARFAANLKELLGSEFLFRMSPRGEISGIRVGERNPKKPGVAPKPTSSNTASSVRNLLPYFRLPEEAVAPGMTWPEQTEYLEPNLGLRRVDLTYQYVRQDLYSGRPVEKITFNSDIRFSGLPRGKVIVDIKQNESHGTVYFDKAAGRLVMKEQKEKLNLTLLEDNRRTEDETQSTVTVKLNP